MTGEGGSCWRHLNRRDEQRSAMNLPRSSSESDRQQEGRGGGRTYTELEATVSAIFGER